MTSIKAPNWRDSKFWYSACTLFAVECKQQFADTNIAVNSPLLYSKLILRLNDDTYQSSCSRTEIKTNRNTLKYFARSELVLCTWIESCSIYLPPPWNVLFFKYYRYHRRKKKHTRTLTFQICYVLDDIVWSRKLETSPHHLHSFKRSLYMWSTFIKFFTTTTW